MKYLKKQPWEIDENQVTPENLFLNRRNFLKLGAAGLLSSASVIEALANTDLNFNDLKFIKDNNPNNLKLNTFEQITSHNNFYEFTTNQAKVKDAAKGMNTKNWMIEIDGLVEKPIFISFDDLVKKFDIYERIYRFRCVEGWSMVVPWNGFLLKDLIKYCKPLSSAKYVEFETLFDEDIFPDQKSKFLAAIKYPYVEGLRMDEAMNDLSMMAIGLYGKNMPPQNGAPIRLIVPWKYGFKSIKSISKITFTDKQPLNTWQEQNPREYGFYANVNPEVDHPRWSQAKERVLGSFLKQKTLMFNGYENEVAHLYKGMDLRKYF